MVKKYALISVICIILLAVGCSLCIHLAPVSYDAGVCSGGFDTWILNKYKDDLLQRYITEHNADNIEIIEGSGKIDYKGRYISIQFDISENDRKQTLYFAGKRVWTETYKWELCQIVHDGEAKDLSDYIASINNIKQINFTVWVLPLLTGMLIRLVFIRWKKGYILSCILALVSVIVWIWTKNLVNNGVDGTAMISGWMSTVFAVGSLIVGGISLLVKKIKKGEADR